MSNIPAGWYDDGQGGQRWWDGTQWTEHTQPAAGPSAPSAPSAPEAPARPAAPQTPGADLPTQIAPNRAADQGGAAQQSPYGAQPSQPAYGGGAASGQPGHSPYGAPAQQPHPGAQGQQAYGAPAAGGYGAQQYSPPPTSGGGGNKKLLLLIGGGVAALVLGIIVLFVLFSVIGGGGPKGVAEDYLEASSDGDLEQVCELSSKSNQKQIFDEAGVDECGAVEDAINEDAPEGESLDDFYEDVEIDYEVGDVKEDGDEATVKYTFSINYTGDEEGAGEFINQDDVEGELTLIKEDGDWKVDGDTSGMIN